MFTIFTEINSVEKYVDIDPQSVYDELPPAPNSSFSMQRMGKPHIATGGSFGERRC